MSEHTYGLDVVVMVLGAMAFGIAIGAFIARYLSA